MKRAAGLAVMVFVMTACGAGNEQAVPRSAACAPSTTADAAASVPVADERPLPAGALPLGLSPSGEVLLEVGRRDDPTVEGSAGLRPGALTVLNPATGHSQRVRERPRPGSQTVFAAVDGDHVVWSQETGTAVDESRWTIAAANRATGAVSRIASAQPVDKNGLTPTVPGYTIPQLHRGVVYWAEARPGTRSGAAPVVNVYARSIAAGSRTRLMVANAILPVPTGDWLYYVSFDGARPGRPGYSVHRKSLRSGAVQLVHRSSTGPGIDFLTADGDTVAWTLQSGVLEVHRGGSRIARIQAREGEMLGWLSAGPDAIAFGDGGGQLHGAYVLDLRTGCLNQLGGKSSRAAVRGRAVIWNELDATGQRFSWRYGLLQ